MKKLLLSLSLMLSFSSFSFDLIDLDNVLAQYGLSADKLKNQGIGIYLGELTGIGKGVDAQKLEGLIADHELILKGQILKKNFKPGTTGKSVADLSSLSLKDGTTVDMLSSQGALIKN